MNSPTSRMILVALARIMRVRNDRDFVDEPRIRQALQLLARLFRRARNGKALDQFIRHNVAVRGAGHHVLVIFVLLADFAHHLHRRRHQARTAACA